MPETARTPRKSSSRRSAANSIELFFEGYTLKQWKRHPRELDASVCGRIPIRTNRDDRYLSESFQALPARRLHRAVRKPARRHARHRTPPRHGFRGSQGALELPDTSSSPAPSTSSSAAVSAPCPIARCASSTNRSPPNNSATASRSPASPASGSPPCR